MYKLSCTRLLNTSIDIVYMMCYNIDTVKGTPLLNKKGGIHYVKGHQKKGYADS